MSPHVILQNDLNYAEAPDIKSFQSWVDAVFLHISNRIPDNVNELCIRIVDTQESEALNRQFRQKQGPTNILSFPNELEFDLKNDSLGDIAICAELVATEADNLGVAIEDHWAHLTIHGVLHLLGYDHIKTEDAKEMESFEIKILHSLNIDNPYEDEIDG